MQTPNSSVFSIPSRDFQSLDLLRALAILLVLGRHSFTEGLWHWYGWSGVDLFFVISGFLVSGLLFAEYQVRGELRIGRFLARRALKIYPSFYLFLSVGLVASWYLKKPIDWQATLSEVFYLQSYLDGLWMHTWSLAVEEHFYLVFALVMVVWKYRKFPKITFTTKIGLLSIFGAMIVWRIIAMYEYQQEIRHDFTATHWRADGIWIGVGLAYLYHFGKLKTWVEQRWFHLLCVIALLFGNWVISQFAAGSFPMNTWGLTAVALGFGGLLCLGLSLEGYLDKLNSMSIWRWVLSGLKYIGKHSYSIYLWHLFADNLLDNVGIFQRMGWVSGGFEAGICTVMLSVCLGITIGQLIEKPILAWRNRILA